jgi:hypothetical protein
MREHESVKMGGLLDCHGLKVWLIVRVWCTKFNVRCAFMWKGKKNLLIPKVDSLLKPLAIINVRYQCLMLMQGFTITTKIQLMLKMNVHRLLLINHLSWTSCWLYNVPIKQKRKYMQFVVLFYMVHGCPWQIVKT